jgi:hypothetical protein
MFPGEQLPGETGERQLSFTGIDKFLKVWGMFL